MINTKRNFLHNPAVNEFAKENDYIVNKTDEWLGTWWIKKH